MDHRPSRNKTTLPPVVRPGSCGGWALPRQDGAEARHHTSTINDQRPIPLATDAANVDIPRIRLDLQFRPATVELTLCPHRLRPRSAFTGDVNIQEVAADRMAIGDFDFRPYGDRQIVRKIDGNIAG